MEGFKQGNNFYLLQRFLWMGVLRLEAERLMQWLQHQGWTLGCLERGGMQEML